MSGSVINYKDLRLIDCMKKNTYDRFCIFLFKFLVYFSSGGSRISQGAPTLVGANLLFGIIFAENCMKMKKIGPRVDARPSCCLDPSMCSGESRRRHSWVGEGQDVGGWEKQILYFASPP